MAEVVTQARQSWPWLGPMLWAASTPDDARGAYALWKENGESGPALDALRTLAEGPLAALSLAGHLRRSSQRSV